MDKKTLRKIIRNLKWMRAKVLATHWIKGMYHEKRGKKDCYCFVGLARKSCGLKPAPGCDYMEEWPKSNLWREMRTRIEDAIISSGVRKRRPDGIEGFNDSKRTKREDIVIVIDEALARAEKDLASL